MAAFHFRGIARWPFRLVRAENWHATLLFFPGLSGAEREQVWEVIAQGVSDGAWGDSRFEWRELALWPSPRRPSLICLEAAPFTGAVDWPLAPLLTREPFSKGETRHFTPFRPHITVIRFDRRWRQLLKREWKAAVGELPPLDPGAITFDRVSFFLSTLSAEQPIYPRERTLALDGSADN